MLIGTLDRSPPPFFRQGPSALTRLIFFSALALFLMVADTRLQLAGPLRAGLATVLYPVQRTLLTPVRAVQGAREYLGGLEQARSREQEAQQRLAEQADRLGRVELLEAENERLRALLGLQGAIQAHTQAAEILYDAPDPYTSKVIIDHGSTHGIERGSPVIDESGVLGQVTRVYPLTSEVTLLVDKDAVIPVLNTRTLVRGIAYGDPTSGGLELRYMGTNADVRADDLLSTSGVDGVYPAGLPVARVLNVERRADSPFAKIALQPVGTPASARHVLVIEPVGRRLPAPPPPEPAPVPARRGPGRS